MLTQAAKTLTRDNAFSRVLDKVITKVAPAAMASACDYVGEGCCPSRPGLYGSISYCRQTGRYSCSTYRSC